VKRCQPGGHGEVVLGERPGVDHAALHGGEDAGVSLGRKSTAPTGTNPPESAFAEQYHVGRHAFGLVCEEAAGPASPVWISSMTNIVPCFSQSAFDSRR